MRYYNDLKGTAETNLSINHSRRAYRARGDTLFGSALCGLKPGKAYRVRGDTLFGSALCVLKPGCLGGR